MKMSKPTKGKPTKAAKPREKSVTKTLLSTNAVSSNWINFLQSNNKEVKFKIASPKPKPKRERAANPKNTKVVAIDCEMVSDDVGQNMLARVSVVDFQLKCIYDKFVKPTNTVGDYRTKFSGIRPSDIENGEDFEVVQKEVRELLRDKFLIGHALKHDLSVLKFGHHAKLIRDTSLYQPFRDTSDGKTPSLRKLTKLFLDETIQEGEHSSIQDAAAAMKLYKKFRHEWEKALQTSTKKPAKEVVSNT